MNALGTMQILQLTGFAFLLASGQILFKKTAISLPPLNSVDGFIALALNPWLWAALILYGTATLLWIIILQNVQLSLAYPFVALGFVLVPLASWLFYSETLSWS
jgi:multidrug transporter EmrE-like cation transporter